jgi:hypothetical protein
MLDRKQLPTDSWQLQIEHNARLAVLDSNLGFGVEATATNSGFQSFDFNRVGV